MAKEPKQIPDAQTELDAIRSEIAAVDTANTLTFQQQVTAMTAKIRERLRRGYAFSLKAKSDDEQIVVDQMYRDGTAQKLWQEALDAEQQRRMQAFMDKGDPDAVSNKASAWLGW